MSISSTSIYAAQQTYQTSSTHLQKLNDIESQAFFQFLETKIENKELSFYRIVKMDISTDIFAVTDPSVKLKDFIETLQGHFYVLAAAKQSLELIVCPKNAIKPVIFFFDLYKDPLKNGEIAICIDKKNQVFMDYNTFVNWLKDAAQLNPMFPKYKKAFEEFGFGAIMSKAIEYEKAEKLTSQATKKIFQDLSSKNAKP